MDVDTACPNCGTVFTVRRDLLGKKTKCTRCGKPFTLCVRQEAVRPPNESQSAPDPPPFPVSSAIQPTTEETHRVHRASPVGTLEHQAKQFFGFESATEPQFPALQKMARAYEVLAMIVACFTILTVLVAIVRVAQDPSQIFWIALGCGMVLFLGACLTVSLLFIAQSIKLALQIESNTRATKKACQRLADEKATES